MHDPIGPHLRLCQRNLNRYTNGLAMSAVKCSCRQDCNLNEPYSLNHALASFRITMLAFPFRIPGSQW